MEFRIHHLDLVEAIEQRSFFEREIRKNIKPIQEMLYNYFVKPVLHIFIKKDQDDRYIIYASMELKGKDILIKEAGSKATDIIQNVLDKLLGEIKGLKKI